MNEMIQTFVAITRVWRVFLGARRRRSRRRGQLMVASVPSATLKFDTDFDFDLSNAQFKKEELATELHRRVGAKGGWDAFLRRLFSDVRLRTSLWLA